MMAPVIGLSPYYTVGPTEAASDWNHERGYVVRMNGKIAGWGLLCTVSGFQFLVSTLEEYAATMRRWDWGLETRNWKPETVL
jgi:hypothetical protein